MPVTRYRNLTPRASAGSFRNATRSRLRSGRTRPIAARPDGHRDRSSLEALVAECRDVERNNLFVPGILETRADMVVGADPHPQVDSGDRDWDRRAEDVWRRWADAEADALGEMSWAGLLASFDAECATAGGALLVLVRTGGPVGVGLQLVEAERLGNPGAAQDTDIMRGGVELDPDTMRARAYHVRRWAAGGQHLLSQTDPMAARHAGGAAWLVNRPGGLRSGQHRAEPELSAAIDWLDHLDSATRGSLVAYQMSAYLALFIQRNDLGGPSVQQQMAASMAAAGDADSASDAVDRGVWQPGAVLEGENGETVNAIRPEHPSGPYGVLMWDLLSVISWRLGMAPAVGLARFVRNYSASRSELAISWRRIVGRQGWIESRIASPVYREVIGRAIRRGALPARPGWDNVRWGWPQMPVFDLKIEAEAVRSAVAAGLMLPSQAARRFGHQDFEDFWAAYSRETALMTAAGATPGAMPAQQTVDVTEDAPREGRDGGEDNADVFDEA